jgi:hypothetical protein
MINKLNLLVKILGILLLATLSACNLPVAGNDDPGDENLSEVQQDEDTISQEEGSIPKEQPFERATPGEFFQICEDGGGQVEQWGDGWACDLEADEDIVCNGEGECAFGTVTNPGEPGYTLKTPVVSPKAPVLSENSRFSDLVAACNSARGKFFEWASGVGCDFENQPDIFCGLGGETCGLGWMVDLPTFVPGSPDVLGSDVSLAGDGEQDANLFTPMFQPAFVAQSNSGNEVMAESEEEFTMAREVMLGAFQQGQTQTDAAKRYRYTGMERDEESGLGVAGDKNRGYDGLQEYVDVCEESGGTTEYEIGLDPSVDGDTMTCTFPDGGGYVCTTTACSSFFEGENPAGADSQFTVQMNDLVGAVAQVLSIDTPEERNDGYLEICDLGGGSGTIVIDPDDPSGDSDYVGCEMDGDDIVCDKWGCYPSLAAQRQRVFQVSTSPGAMVVAKEDDGEDGGEDDDFDEMSDLADYCDYLGGEGTVIFEDPDDPAGYIYMECDFPTIGDYRCDADSCWNTERNNFDDFQQAFTATEVLFVLAGPSDIDPGFPGLDADCPYCKEDWNELYDVLVRVNWTEGFSNLPGSVSVIGPNNVVFQDDGPGGLLLRPNTDGDPFLEKTCGILTPPLCWPEVGLMIPETNLVYYVEVADLPMPDQFNWVDEFETSPEPLDPTSTASNTPESGGPEGETIVDEPVTADENANCRSGPGTVYPVIGFFNTGESATVLGRNADGTWVYVRLPGGRECWVWEGTLTEDSDFNTDASTDHWIHFWHSF